LYLIAIQYIFYMSLLYKKSTNIPLFCVIQLIYLYILGQIKKTSSINVNYYTLFCHSVLFVLYYFISVFQDLTWPLSLRNMESTTLFIHSEQLATNHMLKGGRWRPFARQKSSQNLWKKYFMRKKYDYNGIECQKYFTYKQIIDICIIILKRNISCAKYLILFMCLHWTIHCYLFCGVVVHIFILSLSLSLVSHTHTFKIEYIIIMYPKMSGNKIRLSGIRTTCTCSTLPEISEMHIKILNKKCILKFWIYFKMKM
jgi:hypothetical protein